MGLYGQILFLFTVSVATSHGQPDHLMTLPDASVFELKPPKEFLDLFQPDDSKNLTNPMKSPLIAAITSHNPQDMLKFLPDPSVFEVEPPKEFSELFRLKEKEKVLISAKKESDDVEVTTKSDLRKSAMVDIKQPKENLAVAIEDNEKLVKTLKESHGTAASQTDKTQIFDPKVFEMKPPKEFLELFQLKEKDNLVKEKENVSSDKKLAEKDTSLPNEKAIPNPAVFEMKPPKEFFDLFQLNKKESDIPKIEADMPKKESSGAVDLNLSLPDKKESLPIPEFNNFKEESYEPIKWPSWSFNINNFQEKGFSDWFHLPGMKPQESNNIEKHTETIDSQKPQNVHWSQQTFESHSHYHQSPLEDQQFKPFNMFAPNVGVSGYQNVFSANEDGNDIQVRVTDKLKDPTDNAKVTTSSTEKVSDASNIVSLPSPENSSHDEKGVKTNKYAVDIVVSNGLVQNDTAEIKHVQPKLTDKVNVVDKSEKQQSPPKISVINSPVMVPIPVQLMTSPESRRGFGNMWFMSSSYPSHYQGLSSMKPQKPSHTYGFVYTNKPNNQIPLKPLSSEVKPDVLLTDSTVPQSSGLISGINMAFSNGDKLQNEDQSISGNGAANQEGYIPITNPGTINQNNIPTDPPYMEYPWPLNYPVFGSNSQSYNYPQNQQPAFMNVPYGNNGVPSNYALGNGAPLMNNQLYTGHGVMLPNPTVGGYKQNNLYALVPIAIDYYKQIPYINNIPRMEME